MIVLVMAMEVHFIPVLIAYVLFLGCAITYAMSVTLGHVYYLFPFISDTGAEPPESGVFGYTLNITTVLFLVLMYVRFKQINCVQEKLGLKFSKFWNQAGVVMGFLSCFGLNMVANFQELTMGITHLAGAFLCFTSAVIYFLIQTKISYHFVNQPYGIGKCIFVFRLVLSLLLIPIYFMNLWFGKMAIGQFTGEKLNYWTPNDGGFTYRLISTFSEWMVAVGIVLYILTFNREFRKIQCDNIVLRLKSD